MRNPVVESDLRHIAGSDLPWHRFGGATVLVSGAGGFIPSYLVDTLLYLNETRGLDTRIIALVRDRARAEQRFHYARGDRNLVFLVQDVCGDVTIDGRADYVVHAASIATPKLFRADPVGTILPNVLGTNNLLKLARDASSRGFLFVSTGSVNGNVKDADYPVKEETTGALLDCMDLASCYLESKRMGENLCVAWRHQHGVPVRIARPATIYGPGVRLDDGRAFADFVSCLVHNRDIELYSDGSALRSFCYIADAVLGIFTIILKGADGEAYNISAESEISIRDLANHLVNDVFPEKRLKVIMKAEPSRDFLRHAVPRSVFDVSKLKRLGWDLSFPLGEGFKRTVMSFEPGSPREGAP